MQGAPHRSLVVDDKHFALVPGRWIDFSAFW
jgi:hypothetical protein